MAPEDTSDHHTYQQPRCEFGKTLIAVRECQSSGEVKLDGSLLCEPHAKLVRLQGQETTLLSNVFEMDKWLDNPNNRADELHWRRVLHKRDEVVEQLRFNHTLIEANKERTQQR